ncbi:acyltransferase family protein [Chryseobacterium sp.]|uniref:acyltransferase family protein n=1 Tax=Chryseobacterium sp. TaxID=1871047 RepID=UPI00289CC8AE|nr:acyltransferase family protein [Chryseobacterium sp.]
MKFRNDISFLRAFSVIVVLLYHFKFSFFKGGFTGVDIFFVISGFLMTKIILSKFESGTFEYWEYIQKRVARIIPALLVMIAFFIPVIYFVIPTQFIQYLRSFFSSSLFFSNIYYYLNSGYFDGSSQANFLIHTWSLSVEWQFYMIYPIILMLFRKLYLNNKKRFSVIFIALIAISFITMIIHNQSYSFYMFYTRAWEMMFGGIVFLFESRAKNIHKKTRNIIFSISLASLFGSIFFINSHTISWPSVYTLIPVIATTLILFLNVDYKIFENKLVRFLGDISYSLYLWHWPFFVISMFFGLNLRMRHRVIFIILSLIFAISSYYLIEKRNYRNSKYIIFASINCFLVGFGITFINPNKIFNDEKSKLAYASSLYNKSSIASKQYDFGGRYFSTTNLFSEYDLSNLKIKTNKKYILLLGDSHAGMFSQSLHNIVKNTKYELLQVTADATYPMIDSPTEFEESKKFFNHFFKLEYPKIKDQIVLVIINSNYNGYKLDQLKHKINFSEKFFKKKAIYLGITPTYPIDYPTYYYIKEKYNIVPTASSAFERHTNETNNILKNKLKERYIDLLSVKINKVPNGNPYIYDQHHMTYWGTEEYENTIKNTILSNID